MPTETCPTLLESGTVISSIKKTTYASPEANHEPELTLTSPRTEETLESGRLGKNENSKLKRRYEQLRREMEVKAPMARSEEVS